MQIDIDKASELTFETSAKIMTLTRALGVAQQAVAASRTRIRLNALLVIDLELVLLHVKNEFH